MNITSLFLILAKKKRFTLKVSGTSMLYILRPDDVLTLEKTTFAGIKVNDVAFVIKNRQPMIHRVIYKGKNFFITRGDYAMKSDGRIKPRQLYAKVVKVRRGKQEFRLDDYYLIQSSRYFAEIAKLCEVFVKHEIDFVILKGLPLHLYLEGTHPRRIYADFDILTSPDQYKKAHYILTQLKYKLQNTAYSPTHQRLKNKLTSLSYYKHTSDFPVVIDLHLEPVFLFNQLGRLDSLYPQNLLSQMTVNFLKSKQWISVNNFRLPILSPANLYVYLFLHFFHHNFRGLYRLELIDKLTRKYIKEKNIWNEVTAVIDQYGLHNFLMPTYYFLQKYFSTPQPHKILKRLKSGPLVPWYTKKYIAPIAIYDDENRLRSGMRRFINLFILSPQPIGQRLMIIFDLAVWFSLFWSLWHLVRPSRRR